MQGFETEERQKAYLAALGEEKRAAEHDIAVAEEQGFEAGVEAGQERLAAVEAELKSFGDAVGISSKKRAATR
jgi:hypothetical protein